MPTPPAAFSPLTTTKSGSWRSRRPGSSAARVRRPRPPTTSPTNRSLTAAVCHRPTRYRSALRDRQPAERRRRARGRGPDQALRRPRGAARRVAVGAPRRARRRDRARTAPARPRCCRSWPASSAPTTARVSRGPREIGWVPQQAALYGKLTVAENLRLFARLEKAATIRRPTVERMLDLTGLRDRAGDQVAGALGRQPPAREHRDRAARAASPMLLLDEPSAALDPRQRERVWEFVLSLAEGGTTVIYSTHDIAGGRAPRQPGAGAGRRGADLHRLAARAGGRGGGGAGGRGRTSRRPSWPS